MHNCEYAEHHWAMPTNKHIIHILYGMWTLNRAIIRERFLEKRLLEKDFRERLLEKKEIFFDKKLLSM